MSLARPVALSSAAALLLAASVWGQAAAAALQNTNPPIGAQILAPGDLIRVSVVNTPELTTEARLSPDGSFPMPEAGRVPLAGETAAAAAQTLATALQRTYLLHPQVEVVIRAFAPEPVTVLGAVGAPGVYSARVYPDLGALLAAAGGIRVRAGQRVLVRSAAGAARGDFPVAALEQGSAAGAAATLAMHAGDVVRVLPAATVYVGGDVAKPGAYGLPAGGLSLLDALSLAGGVRHDSGSDHTRIVHRGSDGATQTVWVDARQIMQGRAPDPRLEASDLVYVPWSAGRAGLFAGLRTAADTASRIIWGFVVFH